MAEWLEALRALEQQGTPAVLVTVLTTSGSTPREAGCKMVVSERARQGSIGGGNLEFQSERIARELLADPAAVPVLRDFPLGPELGQCCGGRVRVLFEPVRPLAWHIALFGAGHVGQALVRLLATLPCRVRWIDSRPGALPDACPANVVPVLAATPAEQVAGLPGGASVLVMTHEHQLDFGIAAAALARPDLAFVGLIGSETKRARFTARLARQGFDQAALERLTCPIGVPGAHGKLPAEIAIAVAAQMLQIRDLTSSYQPAPRAVPGPVPARLDGDAEGCACSEETAR
jgi:xanthine dehydrogenase accessory factor